jgi:hypothetical protein
MFKWLESLFAFTESTFYLIKKALGFVIGLVVVLSMFCVYLAHAIVKE